MGRAAAFFDLDRTLLRGASGPLLHEALHEAGLVSRRGLPGQNLFYRLYEVFGETLPGMVLARSAAVAMRGRSQEAVRNAAVAAADRLESIIAPYARTLIEQHRQEGRLIVLATTTPLDLIAPLAASLGVDDIVATRYATTADEDGDHRYTGGLDGRFVWASGKVAGVRQWASGHDVDLSESWAYSDSMYDLPLLFAVGHPVAVNPDLRLAALAAVLRWPQLNLDAPPGVPKVLGAEPFDVLRHVLRPELFPYARFDIAGVEHIPGHGPAIVASNHRSYFDVFALGLTVMSAGRNPRGMAKRELFDAPLIGLAARGLGLIRVDRDKGGSEAFDDAIAALRGGEVVVITPQGTIPRGAAFYQAGLSGHTGVARLAAASGAPVIPVGIWGTELVWPRSARLPAVTNVVHPPTVRVRVGAPMTGLAGVDAEAGADTARIMDAITALLPDGGEWGRPPTEEEIAKATPSS
jgi:putative phosphoserine phosphatase / 1-acylglycerol-3-phosphate O-acyltransferase